MLNSNSFPKVTNTIIWNNQADDSTSSVAASVWDSGNSSTLFSYSLVQNISGPIQAGNTNLDGTNPSNNPLFMAEVDPFSAPTLGGDLRLQTHSPLRDRGNNLADLDGVGPGTATISSLSTDAAGSPRIVNDVIDIGAYEITWESLWNTDFDEDKIPFGLEVAVGQDPDTANPRTFTPELSVSPNPRITIEYNANAPIGVEWVISRSVETLDNFIPILRFNGTTVTFQATGISYENIISGGSPTGVLHTTDTTSPNQPVFYRLETEYVQP